MTTKSTACRWSSAMSWAGRRRIGPGLGVPSPPLSGSLIGAGLCHPGEELTQLHRLLDAFDRREVAIVGAQIIERRISRRERARPEHQFQSERVQEPLHR